MLAVKSQNIPRTAECRLTGIIPFPGIFCQDYTFASGGQGAFLARGTGSLLTTEGFPWLEWQQRIE
jgi:hypothetical protein